jgi:acyl dehydratase
MTTPAATFSFDTLDSFIGQPLGTSGWVDVPQSRIDAFAECTEDRQWIHVDVARSRSESPFGTTVAHGFLTLSLLPVTTYELLAGLKAAKSVNYGMDKLRFIAPVKAGARVRNHIKLLSVERRADGWVMLRTENTVEIEGEAKPALVAVSLGLFSAT